LRVVVLPQPDGPSSATITPGLTSRSSASTAALSCEPKHLLSPDIPDLPRIRGYHAEHRLAQQRRIHLEGVALMDALGMLVGILAHGAEVEDGYVELAEGLERKFVEGSVAWHVVGIGGEVQVVAGSAAVAQVRYALLVQPGEQRDAQGMRDPTTISGPFSPAIVSRASTMAKDFSRSSACAGSERGGERFCAGSGKRDEKIFANELLLVKRASSGSRCWIPSIP